MDRSGHIAGAARPSRPALVAAAEALGWLTLAAVACGGGRLAVAGRPIELVDVGLLAAPWVLLLVIGRATGALAALEDVPLLRRAHALLRAGAARPGRALLGAGAVYVAVLLWLGFARYAGHVSGAYDLGIFDQVVWGTLHGAPLRSSLKGGTSILGDHFSPVLALLAPAYLVWEDARALLVAQAVAVAAGLAPAWALARRRFGATPLALAFALAYLAYPATRYVNGYDFHPVTLAVPALLAAALWLEQGRLAPFLGALAFAAGCQENVPLAIAGWGVLLAVVPPRRPALGAALAVGGLGLFLALVLVVIPGLAGTERFQYLARYGHLGASVGEILRTLVTRPWLALASLVSPPPKIEYLLRLLGPLALLPLVRGGRRWLLPVAPVLLQNVLSRYPPMYSVAFQYTAPMIPFLLLGAMDGARGLLDRAAARGAVPGTATAPGTARIAAALPATPRTVGLALAAALLLGAGESQVWHARLAPRDPRFARIEPVLAGLPTDASVSAQAGLYTHLAHRHGAYLFPDRVGEVDYVVVDRRGWLHGWQLSRDEFERAVAALPARGYQLVLEQDGFAVYRRSDRQSASHDPRPQ